MLHPVKGLIGRTTNEANLIPFLQQLLSESGETFLRPEIELNLEEMTETSEDTVVDETEETQNIVVQLPNSPMAHM